jgi:hypothetical protein
MKAQFVALWTAAKANPLASVLSAVALVILGGIVSR